ncbi:MAG: 4Fe-4S binding protein, partial [Lachnospiraceae bacterium]|nr:4Fe-4S binding protein [Lachnospiraceae bacterium]
MTELHELKQELIAEARRLGLYSLGFAPVERWAEAAPAILAGTPLPSEPREAYYPQNIWPWSKTVIVGAVPLPLPMGQTTPANFYTELYNTTNRVLDDAAYRLSAFLIGLGYRAHFFPRDGYGEIAALVEKPEAAFSQVVAAKCAGLGTIGRNHCLLTEGFGPRVRLVSIITDAEFPSDPLRADSLCTGCGACEGACPIGAFTPPHPETGMYEMERYKCAKYHQFLREEMRYPCGACVMACPVGEDKKLYGRAAVSTDGCRHLQNFGSKERNASEFYENKRRFIMSNRNYRFETKQIHAGQ